jgi:hypothetical protein
MRPFGGAAGAGRRFRGAAGAKLEEDVNQLVHRAAAIALPPRDELRPAAERRSRDSRAKLGTKSKPRPQRGADDGLRRERDPLRPRRDQDGAAEGNRHGRNALDDLDDVRREIETGRHERNGKSTAAVEPGRTALAVP